MNDPIKEEPKKEEVDIKLDNTNKVINTNSVKDGRDYNKNTIHINAGATKSFYMFMNIGSNMKLKSKKDEAKSEKTRKDKSKFKKRSNISDDEKPKRVRFKEVLESSSSMIEEYLPKKEEVDLDDYELNHLKYLAAIKLDKRNCCQIYCSLLRRDQNFMSTFCVFDDYNLYYAKFAKFIFVLATLMAMNAFLFADKSFHKLFLSGVHYYINYQLLQMSLSIIITYVAEVILCYVTYTDRYIYEIKNFYKNEKNQEKIFKILKFIRTKLITFYIVCLVILLFYWYFISAFCAVYPNTQKIYLLDCTISFAVFSIIPFIVYAIATVLRLISMKDVEKKRFKCLYKASQTFPIF